MEVVQPPRLNPIREAPCLGTHTCSLQHVYPAFPISELDEIRLNGRRNGGRHF